jgi:hypothetical protein
MGQQQLSEVQFSEYIACENEKRVQAAQERGHGPMVLSAVESGMEIGDLRVDTDDFDSTAPKRTNYTAEQSRIIANAEEVVASDTEEMSYRQRLNCAAAIKRSNSVEGYDPNKDLLSEIPTNEEQSHYKQLIDRIAKAAGLGSRSTYKRLERIWDASKSGDENARRIFEAIESGSIGIQTGINEWKASINTTWDLAQYQQRRAKDEKQPSCSDACPPLDISWAERIIERTIAIQAYWNDTLGKEGLPSPGIVATALQNHQASPDVSRSTVGNWIEPLRDRWKWTTVDPNDTTAYVSVNLDEVGVGALCQIGQLSTTKGNRVKLLRRAENGSESIHTISELKQSGQSVEDYLEGVDSDSE